MERWQCIVCGYIYDPEKGDPENGVNPGTFWEELADSWGCPECGASREEFERIEY